MEDCTDLLSRIRIKNDHFTQVSNDILDTALQQCTPVECKLLLVIARQTCGFHKSFDRISLSQFRKKTKLSKPSIIKGLKSLRESQWIYIYYKCEFCSLIANENTVPCPECSSYEPMNGYYALLTTEVVNEIDYLVNEIYHKSEISAGGSKQDLPQVVNKIDHEVVNEVDQQNKGLLQNKINNNKEINPLFYGINTIERDISFNEKQRIVRLKKWVDSNKSILERKDNKEVIEYLSERYGFF